MKQQYYDLQINYIFKFTFQEQTILLLSEQIDVRNKECSEAGKLVYVIQGK